MRAFLGLLLPGAVAHGGALHVSSASALRDAIVNGAQIEIANDIVLDEKVLIPAGYDVEISSSNRATLIATNWAQHFHIKGKLRLENLVLTNATNADNERRAEGGAMYVANDASLVLVDCIVANSTASFGAGLFAGESSNVEIYRTTFAGNDVGDYRAGGAIYTERHRSLKIVESLFVANMAPKGGAIQAMADAYGDTEIFNTNFVGNKATSSYTGIGGAIACHFGPLIISGSTFIDNEAVTHGGAIFISPPSVVLTVVSTKFEGNIGEPIVSWDTGEDLGQKMDPPVIDCAATCDGLGGGTCAPVTCAGCPYLSNDCNDICACSSCDCTHPTFPTPQPTGPSPAPTVTPAPTLAPHDASWWRANAGTTDGAAGGALSPLAVLAAILVLILNPGAASLVTFLCSPPSQ